MVMEMTPPMTGTTAGDPKKTKTPRHKKIELLSYVTSCPNRPTNLTMQLPQDITTHIAGFIADEVRGTDPQCYRSARSLQAIWRGWLTRTHLTQHVYDFWHNACDRCDADRWTQRLCDDVGDLVWVCDACSDHYAADEWYIEAYSDLVSWCAPGRRIQGVGVPVVVSQAEN